MIITNNIIIQKGKYSQITLIFINMVYLCCDVFSKVNPTSSKDMGKIMAAVTPLVKGKADMREVSNIIKNKLN